MRLKKKIKIKNKQELSQQKCSSKINEILITSLKMEYFPFKIYED